MSQHNPWKTLGSRVVYKNPWMSVREDAVIRPDGQEGIYGVMECRAATGVVALDHRGRVILVGQFRYPTQEYSWEIVEGGADHGESPAEAARRELAEEAGLDARTWIPLGGPVHLSNCITSEVGHLFLARDLRPIDRNPEGTEVLELAWRSLDECEAMLERGEIKDAMTIIGLLRTLRLRGGAPGTSGPDHGEIPG